MVSERIRSRYLQDPFPIRLAGLAMDLGRIAQCAGEPRDAAALLSLLEEGKWFAEWAAPDAPPEIQEQLSEIQIALARWQLRGQRGELSAELPEQARHWSEQLLQHAGLV